jgi:hypothetical protein
VLPWRERSGGEWSVTGIVAAGAAGLPWFLGSWSAIVVLFLCYVLLNEVLPVCHCLLRSRWWLPGEEEVELVVIRRPGTRRYGFEGYGICRSAGWIRLQYAAVSRWYLQVNRDEQARSGAIRASQTQEPSPYCKLKCRFAEATWRCKY